MSSAPNYALTAIIDTMTRDLKEAMKGPVMKQLEAEVDAMIDKVVAELNVRAQAEQSFQHMRQNIVFLVDRGRA